MARRRITPPLPSASAPRGDDTRQALIAAAQSAFAARGFDAVSLREIAEGSGINPALVGYHFGHKEGLYLAVFEHIVAQLRERVGARVEGVEALLAAPRKASRQQLLEVMGALTDNMLVLLASDDSADWARLIVREQLAPSAAFEVLYEGFMGRVLRLLTALCRRLRPHDDETTSRLIVATLLGQLMVFRVARTGVLRHMQWRRIGAAELAAVQARVRANFAALLQE